MTTSAPSLPSQPTFAAHLPPYAELHCLSNFSFLRGASHPHELVERAMSLGYRALAITDECSLAGVVRAYTAVKELEETQARERKEREAKAQQAMRAAAPEEITVATAATKHEKKQLPKDDPPKDAPPKDEPPKDEPLKPIPHLIIGSEFNLTDAEGQPFCTLVALALNRNGYGNLSELITLARSRADKGCYRIGPEDFTEMLPHLEHLRGLPDCVLLLVPQRAATLSHTLRCAHWLASFAAQRAWIALELWQTGSDDLQLDALRMISQDSGLPLVAAGGTLMHVRSRKPLQDTMTAIGLGTPLSACGHALEANAERHLRTRVRLGKLYPRETLEETLRIAALCRFSLEELQYEYPEELVPADESPSSYLRKLVMAGAMERWPGGMDLKRIQQIEKELGLIADLKYEKYFLTVHDIVSFARSRNILCQGRGSAANSIVCYCLHVTEIDPVSMNMLIERFISRARNEPPDIDVDFEHQRREEVIQYIYAKYGRHRAALTASLITYRSRSALKDVGKALGLEASLIERISKSQQWWDGPGAVAAYLAEAGFDARSHITRNLIRLTQELRNFPRHLSQHVGGFVIAKDRLSRLVPIENASMKERSVIEWDKDDIDALKLLKVDVLALGMLSAIRRALEFVALRRGLPRFRMQDIPREDRAVYEMCGHADTIGVFQIESRAQQSMLPRLKPDKYYDLVIEVAIVRPGPIQGGMVHPYLRRKQGLEPIDYAKDELRPVLERTLGVPIFQEQVMHLAMVAAKYTGEQADQLRRAMAAWRRSGNLAKYQKDLTDRMLARGYEQAFIERICKQIEGFGEYGFPESHAASFALLVYLSAWLKRYEPAAFLAGLLNSQPLGFYSPSQLVQDARRHGVKVLPPDVTLSDWESTFERRHAEGRRIAADETRLHRQHAVLAAQQLRNLSLPHLKVSRTIRRAARRLTARVFKPASTYGSRGPAVRLGMHLIKGLARDAAERIMAARRDAPLVDVDDLARRAALTRRDLEALAVANALVGIAGHRREAWWAVTAQHAVPKLLRDAPIAEAPLALPRASEHREIVDDYASFGLTLNRHPLALLRARLARHKFRTAAELAACRHGTMARACGIVTVRQRPGTANGTVFVSIEDETGSINVIVWPSLVEKQRKALLGSSLLAVYGVLQRDDGVSTGGERGDRASQGERAASADRRNRAWAGNEANSTGGPTSGESGESGTGEASRSGEARRLAGRKQKGEVVHLVAHRLEDYSEWLGELATTSRDFH
ncbi:error-prone DNA polymerase [Burkholderia sp. Ax-1724]|uniref:error-prone DNA polymerase n=1 Tax=Burkholderia sp. Ax-1724 TaxID=2608336 RepID=UPI00142392E0|nr:error-prone DNA polymerase [Burkholderia sp. Ax-1724]NIF56589.1 error-prone DNA polymerase [Burkholderia sp. Ax-1724]